MHVQHAKRLCSGQNRAKHQQHLWAYDIFSSEMQDFDYVISTSQLFGRKKWKTQSACYT
jgi:hypothetical protein